MSRRKTEINTDKAERVKIIREAANLSQKEFGDLIGLTQQSINRIEKLKQPLEEPNAKRIIEVFPEYRLEWLLAYDNFMNVAAKRHDTESHKWKRADCLLGIINNEFMRNGYRLKMCVVGESFDGYRPTDKDGYYVIENKSNKTVRILSCNDYFRLEEEIELMVGYLIDKTLKTI